MSSTELLAEVRRWLRFAREDLDGAETLLADEGFVPRRVCWLAQQAAEKALKGALASQEIPFPFRHDLDALRNLLPAPTSPRPQPYRSSYRSEITEF